eukprot:GHVT01002838.1.p2 GENE.GHVT01002838.1~~GHVT01002838.1.p2  ORF type:complete len:108 (+),score=16.89 GHVT01002838.1:372-695(+)
MKKNCSASAASRVCELTSPAVFSLCLRLGSAGVDPWMGPRGSLPRFRQPTAGPKPWRATANLPSHISSALKGTYIFDFLPGPNDLNQSKATCFFIYLFIYLFKQTFA